MLLALVIDVVPLAIGQSARGGGSWIAGAMAAVGVALVTVTLLRRFAKQRASSVSGVSRTADASSDVNERGVTIAAQRTSLDDLMVEVEELTRVCAAQMESRAMKLELLIAQADERIRRLEAQSTEAVAPKAQVGAPAVVTVPVAPAAAKRAASVSSRADLPMAAPADVRSRIRAMAAEGRSALEISRAVDEPVGKVELILALHNAERARA